MLSRMPLVKKNIALKQVKKRKKKKERKEMKWFVNSGPALGMVEVERTRSSRFAGGLADVWAVVWPPGTSGRKCHKAGCQRGSVWELRWVKCYFMAGLCKMSHNVGEKGQHVELELLWRCLWVSAPWYPVPPPAKHETACWESSSSRGGL